MVALAEGFDLPFDVSQEYLRAYRIFSDWGYILGGVDEETVCGHARRSVEKKVYNYLVSKPLLAAENTDERLWEFAKNVVRRRI